jgi:hypothetical protein
MSAPRLFCCNKSPGSPVAMNASCGILWFRSAVYLMLEGKESTVVQPHCGRFCDCGNKAPRILWGKFHTTNTCSVRKITPPTYWMIALDIYCMHVCVFIYIYIFLDISA